MGLIKAIAGAVGGTAADQWLEFFSMDSLPTNVLAAKGQKVINGRSSNTRGSDNIISNGSGIVVADGQAVAIINNGMIVEFAADPGMYTFDSSTTPSIFADTGGFGKNLLAVFADGIERFQRGGGVYQDQRVYYFNVKEIYGNKYGTAELIPYRVVDTDIGLDMDVDLRCNGEFSYKLTNPILFYQNVAGNVSEDYTREMIDSQLKAELLTGLNIALARISAQGIRYSALPGHAMQIADEINDILSNKWRDLRGIEVVSFAVNSVSISDEDEKRIKDLQAMKSLRDPSMAGAALVAAQADAMRSAAENEGGAAIGFMGLNLASQAGSTATAATQMLTQPGVGGPPMTYPTASDGGFGAVGGAAAAVAPVAGVDPSAAAVAPAAPVAEGWVCPNCGQTGNAGNFCANCGTPKPVAPAAWTCPTCNKDDNVGNFCANCGTPKP
ncbi:MAG: SPFH domain-containing protein [Coriobacteriia bacterium]|nr:SPFH domain-containing protein [Coriobacteriia bacterium]